MLLSRAPFFRFSLAFLLGILAGGSSLITSLQGAMIGFGIFFSLYVLLVTCQIWTRAWSDRISASLGVVGLLAFVAAGCVRFLQQDPLLDKKHVFHLNEKIEAYEGVVEECRYYEKSGVLTLALKRVKVGGVWSASHGRVEVWMPVEKAWRYRYGDFLEIGGTLREIRGLGNPYAFDYRSWAAGRGVYHQGFVYGKVEVVRKGYAPRSRVMAAAYRVRHALAAKLRAQVDDPVACGMVQALVLGIREGVNQELKEVFSAAGILHILAVSGLHVGMLYAILLFLLSLLGAYGDRRRKLQGVVILSVLWSYAFITALSPSVVRAVTMFSLVTLSRLGYRRYVFWNGLAASAFFGLLYRPLWAWQVGFQLSYGAVMGIGLLYPWLEGLVKERKGWRKSVWSLVAVSLSVQVVSFPLSLYYFHYFPTYFLLGNLIGVPAASVILFLGLLSCLTGTFSPLWGKGLAWVLSMVVKALYVYGSMLKKLPMSRLGPVWLSAGALVFLYGVLVFLGFFFKERKFYYLPLAAIFACVFGRSMVVKWWREERQRCVMVYNVPKCSAVCFVEGRQGLLLTDVECRQAPMYTREIRPSMEAMGVKRLAFVFSEQERLGMVPPFFYRVWKNLKVVVWHGKVVVWLDGACLVPPRSSFPLAVDLLIVHRDYPLPAHIAFWLTQLAPQQVVLDHNLAEWKKKRIADVLKTRGIPFHDLKREGALVKEIKE